MKLQIYIMLLLGGLTVCSCNYNEPELFPSNAEVDRVYTQLDTENPIAMNIYETYNSGVLFEYDRILDFAFIAASKNETLIWDEIEIPQMKNIYSDTLGVVLPENEEAYKLHTQNAVAFIDSTLFRFFKPNSIISELMPYKVLLSDGVFCPRLLQGDIGNVLIESESRQRSSAIYDQRAIYNKHSIVFSVNPDVIGNSVQKYTRDNFYIMLSRIMDMHGLYGKIPPTFFDGKDEYYNKDIEMVYREELGLGEEKRVDVIEKDWFFSKGFVDATYFYTNFGLRTYNQYYDEDNNRLPAPIRHTKAIRPGYEFISGRRKDVRSYINEMIHRNANELNAFPENIKANIVLLRDELMSWGVDIVGINPALETLN
ncbi:hypothetical protein [Aestuariibaculum suncheonense]|uniref:Uncharacterized protein n=1 Tax=Aestuariibaculum suncheonense TaxID=1028745 RepID=A0A8J6QCJ7_9FLAO|nr:hypothetical protein [Aestuariibaculum suncheonense]MBD0834387.1 hypothetical protein [Aestuariibaculum suncheonense]